MNKDCTLMPGPCTCGAWHTHDEIMSYLAENNVTFFRTVPKKAEVVELPKVTEAAYDFTKVMEVNRRKASKTRDAQAQHNTNVTKAYNLKPKGKK